MAASGGSSASLRYDPLGRLYEVTGASGTTRFLYDGDALVGEYVGGALTARYVHGSNAGADDPLLWYPGAGTSATNRRNLLADHQGSIVAISDNAGNRLAVNSYDEWGIPGSGNLGRFQYTGQAWIAELGMYYYKARIYSPTLGRYLQTDPVGYQDQTNLYAYVGNDPVNRGDPTGLAMQEHILTFARGVDLRVTIDETMSPDDNRLATDTMMGAANLTMGMDLASTLPAESRDAMNALDSVSVSHGRAGYDTATGNFNINMGELRASSVANANQGAGAAAATATNQAGNMVHDGKHAQQNQAGQLASNHYSSVPSVGTPARAAFDSIVVQTERAANGAQVNFYRATPTPPHVTNSMIRALNGMTDADILARYHRP